MKEFIGTKRIKAIPMTRLEYNNYRNWKLPEDEQLMANESGFLVEYLDGGRANDDRHEGYISWSPVDVFVKSYQDTEVGMSFGHAIEMTKAGFKIARAGWNGKNMWLKLVNKGYFDVGCSVIENADTLLPWIGMKTACNSFVPWLASQSDMLAEDWIIIK